MSEFTIENERQPNRPLIGVFFMSHPQRLQLALAVVLLLVSLAGCDKSKQPGDLLPSTSPSTGNTWLGIPSAVNQVIIFLHDGTGWLLNKSEVSVKKVGDVRAVDQNNSEMVADFQITVHLGGETFETTAKNVPCDDIGIPTEASIDRLRTAVEEIKVKMKRLQD